MHRRYPFYAKKQKSSVFAAFWSVHITSCISPKSVLYWWSKQGVCQRKSLRKEIGIMKKIICKVEYDTETAQLIGKATSGEFGDPAGYEESLYLTEDGKYFIYVNGGAESIYPKEDIKRLAKDKVKAWKSEKGI